MSYKKEIVSHRVPFGLYTLQNMGRQHRVFRGEGEFAGEDAYTQFRRLATVFYDANPGTLTHPLWDTTTAYFAALGLRQEPTRDYVSYDFEFWECYGGYGSGLSTPGVLQTKDVSALTGGGESGAASLARYYTVSYGESLWTVAEKNGLEPGKLLALNPQIKNLNQISAGQRLRIS
ncbi:MAG: LysM peptidoglycan-binding domain-containing protein [Butyricicoccus sp.]|nr:LysM peptidoglycan-binding domain-containing protein [Butyricicoccus sp.]